MTARELKSLYSQRMKIGERISEIECAARRRTQAKHVGKAFVFMNSFSGSPRWPLYMLVKSMDENGLLRGHQFETREGGEVSICLDALRISIHADYREISRAEFDAAWTALLETLHAA